MRQRFSAAAFEYAVVPRGLRLLETGEPIAAGVLKGKRILAFCGIARPERFFSLLVENGLPPQTKMPFPDHFLYPPPSLDRLAAAGERDRIEALLTTEKDAVKLLGRTWAFASTPLYVLDVGLDLPPAFFEKISASLGPAGPVDDLNRSQATRPS
ncbi:MAG: tetraacyldisaccharide 4'-kinase [Candidatus Aminicenantes bacterium]|nr:tetraacyldisaccharide 4'-kinase [Candidatus Aminicenantes bacterium]